MTFLLLKEQNFALLLKMPCNWLFISTYSPLSLRTKLKFTKMPLSTTQKKNNNNNKNSAYSNTFYIVYTNKNRVDIFDPLRE